MPSFAKIFRNKDASKKTTLPITNGNTSTKPQWTDSWLRTRVDPEEVAELLRGCTRELKTRALDVPFLILPFRPSSDPSAARTFVRNYFLPADGRPKLKGEKLAAELKMTEVMVLVSVIKWCWARLPGGIISWQTYDMFKIGEKDSHFARDAFSTFLPISVESKARIQIINDFFDLLASLAAHAKTNGLGGHKLSRYAGWWAFEHYDSGKGFDAGYKSWNSAADATSHMFFAYLRSLVPEPGKTNGILDLPRSLQQLVAATPYPPPSSLLSNDTTKLVMIVDVVSPTPYALLRRAKNFEYRDDDKALRQFSNHDDPVEALTTECRRVLRAISATNQSHVSDAKTSTSLTDPSWSRFEDIGFSSALDEIGEEDSTSLFPLSNRRAGLSTVNSQTRTNVMDLNRPTTPSWADFLSSGFANDNGSTSPILLPPDKILPPIMPQPTRGQSSQSYRKDLETASALEPGEVASITRIAIDDAFWWVWISSLAGEEPVSRKAVFGRCAYVETDLTNGHWMIMEEQVKGAAPEPIPGAYIAEKKGFLGFTTKAGRLTRRRSGIKKSSLAPSENYSRTEIDTSSRTTLAPDQQAKIRTAALELSRKKKAEEAAKERAPNRRNENDSQNKTSSIYTLGPLMKDEASPALQWAKQYDKNAIRKQYLGNELAGKGSMDHLNSAGMQKSTSSLVESKDRDLPPVPREQPERAASLTPPSVPEKSAYDAVTVPHVPEKSTEQLAAAAESPVSTKQSTLVTPKKEVEPTKTLLDPVRLSYEGVEALPVISNPQFPPTTLPTHTSKVDHSPPESKEKTPQLTGRQNGIKRLFGTMRKNKEESERKPPVSPIESNPAVAAARRALEGKVNPASTTDSPPLSPNHFSRYQSQSVKDRVAALTQTAGEPKIIQPAPMVEKALPTPVSAPAPAQTQVKEFAPVPIQKPESEAEPQHEPVRHTESSSQPPIETKTELDAPLQAQPLSQPHPASVDHAVTDHKPPITGREAEFDQLSRVDTHEREQADHEFSRFDQGPLQDQPAFIPPDSPTKTEMDDEFEDASTHHQKHQSIYSAVTMQTDATDEDFQPDGAKQISPNDRWAQIRRNAAERAARSSEDHGERSRTDTRTDDGDTSGEETIESRVARIKARVAELTGNMEQTRR